MPKRAATLRLDEKKLRLEVHAAASRSRLSDDEVVEEGITRFVELEVLDELWSRNHLAEDEAMEIVTSELRALRSEAEHPDFGDNSASESCSIRPFLYR